MTNLNQKKRNISGWFILDKPPQMGSTSAVARIKKLFNANKAGHAGTLDPLASGALPIALGDATKTVPYVIEGRKTYIFSVEWGCERVTDDLEGDICAVSSIRPTREQIELLLPNYIGRISQIPPQYSAIKINGKRAYNLAREGASFEIPERFVEIHSFVILNIPSSSETVFRVECGRGTYVRSLARDLGRQLNCYGHITQLRRLNVFPFTEDRLIPLSKLEEMASPDSTPPCYKQLDSLLIPTLFPLQKLPQIVLNVEAFRKISNGGDILLTGLYAPIEMNNLCVTYDGKIVAIGNVSEGYFRPNRVF